MKTLYSGASVPPVGGGSIWSLIKLEFRVYAAPGPPEGGTTSKLSHYSPVPARFREGSPGPKLTGTTQVPLRFAP
jgi:hypothetical protein